MLETLLNNPELQATLAVVIGWIFARVKDAIDLHVAKTKNGWDNAIWEAVKGPKK